MKHCVGDRIQIDDHICTIKFIGEIARWPGVLTYGVEWDSPARGKNSGSVDNITYFQTDIANAGSFIKESKLMKKLATKSGRRTFWDSLSGKYGNSTSLYERIAFGQKEIESLGFEKLDAKNKDFKKLNTISLSQQGIHNLIPDGDFAESEKVQQALIKQNCQNIQTLDLSFNLFRRIDDICKLLVYLPNLTELNLSGNRFCLDTKSSEISEICSFNFPQMKSLYLTSGNLSASRDIIKVFLSIFPNLNTLDLSFNNLVDESLMGLTFPKTLQRLILSNNSLTSFSYLSGIDCLDFSHNKFQVSSLDNLISAKTVIRELDLSHNNINEWSVVDEINSTLPQLKSIRILNNALFTNVKLTTIEQDKLFNILIARLEAVTKIDYSIITAELRKSAELFFITAVMAGEMTFCKTLPRWTKLKALHGIDSDQSIAARGRPHSKLRDMILNLTIIDKNNVQKFTIKAFSHWNLLTLKGSIAAKIGMNVTDFTLFRESIADSRTEEEEELDNFFFLLKDYLISDQDVLCIHKQKHNAIS